MKWTSFNLMRMDYGLLRKVIRKIPGSLARVGSPWLKPSRLINFNHLIRGYASLGDFF